MTQHSLRGPRQVRPFPKRGGLGLGTLLLGAVLSACGQEITGASATGGRDALIFSDSAAGLAPMYLGEVYTAPLSITGGAGPYSLRLIGGALPDGVRLSGQRLSGTPTKAGTYKFTLEATDSTLSTRSREYTVNVQTLPPLALTPTLPRGEIRGETRIPLTITSPRGARAARLSWELPEAVQVTRVQPAEAGAPLFWRQDGRVLTLDLGFRAVPRTGARVALISVKPARAATLSVTKLGFEARDGEGKLIQEQKLPEPPKPATPAPAPATPTVPAPAPAPTTPAAPATPTTPAPTAPAPTTPAPTTPETPATSPAPATPESPNPTAPLPEPPAPATPGDGQTGGQTGGGK